MTLMILLRQLGSLLAVATVLAIWQPDSVEPQAADLVSQGRQALDADRIDDAITLLEKAVAAEPKNPAALVYLNLGLAQKKAGRPAEARAAWEKGKRLYPAAPEAAAFDRELRGL